ncbi:MAG: LD-carboxypeptidase [Synergistaceae bacterium]|nr:LD-carboxypeptidase [Synergistaceae bacterium]MBR0221247.1 LD-carboxypeptidase [Synergistaceae bacterium]
MKNLFKNLIALSLVLILVMQAEAERLKGVALTSGDVIGVLAPASYADDEDFIGSIELLKEHGYKVKLGKSAHAQYEHFAGTDRKRAEDINNFFADDEVKAILCVRGGYGSARVLERLDYKMIAKHPKPLIGFSDVTALHIALGEKAGLVTIHGPMLVSFVSKRFDSEYSRRNFFDGLRNYKAIGEVVMPEGRKLETVIPGKAEGFITGGNLTVLTSLVGTPYELNGKGCLLLLEEIGESPYRIDRMLNQLYQNGLLSRVNGIILGDFKGCDGGGNDPDKIDDFSLEQVLRHYARLSRKPVIKNMPSGHGNYNLFLPFGVHAVMNADGKGSASLVIDEAALAER